MLFSLLSVWNSRNTPRKQSSCLQCGQCCKGFGWHLHCSDQDLARWRARGRDDLLARVNHLGWIWVDPHSKQPVAPCPFIERTDPEHFRCAIYEDRPDMCRDYPTLAHSKRCLRGVFLSWWAAVCCGVVPEWVVLAESLTLTA